MYCYKDMTFCPFYANCKDGNSCHRALTEEVIKKAGEMAISQFVNEPECFNKLIKEEK